MFVALVLMFMGVGISISNASPASSLRVSGNQLLDAGGRSVRLLGVNRSGTEYACVQGWGIFDGPSDTASVAAIARWNANAVRVPLNEDCWLGINGAPAAYSGAAYRSAIHSYVAKLHAAGLFALLDLHWNAPGNTLAIGQQIMADSDHAPDFWSSVSRSFLGDSAVAFDLYNEPHDISWPCWRDGCTTSAGWGTAGMQSLVNAVRSTGATQPILVGGLGWASDLTNWLTYLPQDPARQLVASIHLYNFSGCSSKSCWDSTLTPVAAAYPVVTGEVGENGCGHSYTDSYTTWADNHGISYLGWSWNTADCSSGPALISNFDGTPTAFGRGLRDHLLTLTTIPAPSSPATAGATSSPPVTPTPSPSVGATMSAMPTPLPGASSTPPSPPTGSGFDFEDGTTQGWTTQWGNAAVTNSSGNAYAGNHSLAVKVGGGYPAVGVRAGLQSLAPGSRVQAHLLVPAGGPAISIEPFSLDNNWSVTKSPAVAVQPGAWTSLSWPVPSSGELTAVGIQVDAGTWSGQLYIDSVSWTPPHLNSFEDGGISNWSMQWGSGGLTTVVDPKHSGGHSLAVNFAAGYPAVGTRQVNGIFPGSTVSMWVALPINAQALAVEPFIQDGAFMVSKATRVWLKPGIWQQVSWTVPLRGIVTVVGLQVDAGNASGIVYVDDVAW